MKVRLAFYKHNKSIVDKLVVSYTKLFTHKTPPYSHVELGLFINSKWSYFSSTLRDNSRGTRWISEERLFKHPERWDVYEYDSYKTKGHMLLLIEELIPASYDFLGIFGFVTLFGLVNDKTKWYCSEACWKVLFYWRKRISPIRMYSELKGKLKKVT